MSMIPVWLSLLLTALAAIRAGRLISTDMIFLPFKRWVLRKNGETGWFTFLVHCKYCVTVWTAAIAATCWYFFSADAGFIIPVLAGAIAQVQVYLVKLDEV